MGGICGIIGLGDKWLIAKMSDAIRHRGTIEELLVDDYISLCSRSSNGGQIIEHAGVTAILDGEMYNKRALKQNLEDDGHSFSSQTEAEVLTHLYETYGKSCADRIRGPFAFCIWNSKKKTLLLARDKSGERPIFYTFSNGYLLFASEIKALLRADIVKKNINPQGLTYFFSRGHVPFPNTLFKGIRKLPSASIMEFSKGKLVLQEYWKLDLSKINWGLDEETWCKVIHDSIVDCIKIRLGKGPLGILLGGLDSSATASLIKNHTHESLKSFTITYENEEFNEPYARLVSEWLGMEFHEKRLYAKDLIRILPKLVYLIDDPKAEFATFPTYPALELAKKYVGTVFTADDVDTNFWGNSSTSAVNLVSYGHPPALVGLAPKMEHVISFIKGKTVRPESGKLPVSFVKKGDGLYHTCPVKTQSPKTQSPIKFAFKLAISSTKIRRIVRALSLMTEVRRMNRLAESAGWGISRVERICSAFSLNLRLPFEDFKIKEVASKIPPYLKQSNRFVGKYIWRKTILKYDLLPKKVIMQRKRGFGNSSAVPRWIERELRDYVHNNVLEIIPYVKQFLDERSIVKRLREGKALHSLDLSKLLIFSLWYKRFFLEG